MKRLRAAPSDRGCLVGICFFILGLGTLLPWNFFMTASLYFQRRLSANASNVTDGGHGDDDGGGSGYSKYFNSCMTLLSQLPLLLFTLLNSILYQRIPEAVRIGGSLIFILLLFVFTAALVKVEMDTERFFSVTMATIWFINSFGAVLQGSLFGLVGMLPQKYSAVFMSGQGLAGTFAAVAMLLATASDAHPESAALGYFITPCVGTLATLACYLLLPRLEFARHYLGQGAKYEPGATDELLAESLTADGGKLNGRANGSAPVKDGDCAEGSEARRERSREAFLALGQVDKKQAKASIFEVFKKIWVMAFCVTFVFTVTLSVFPTVTVDVRTTALPGKWDDYFIIVCCFLTFNINDWLGRTVTTLIRWPRKESPLFPLLVVSRVVFIPLLMLCNVQPRVFLPVYFASDAVFAVIVALFSISSGYFVCLSMSYAPQLVEAKDAETAGSLMTFFLALGLSIGAALSFLLRRLV